MLSAKLSPYSMHQCDIVYDRDPQLRQEDSDGQIIEVLVLGADDVCLPDHRGLDYKDVVHVSDRHAQYYDSTSQSETSREKPM